MGAACLAYAGPAYAGPAAPIAIVLTQPGGGQFAAEPFGDEWYNGHETADGYTVLQDAQGVWRFAVVGADGRLQPGLLRPDRDRPSGLAPHLRDRPPANPNVLPVGLPGLAGHSGTERVLVILAAFNNRASVGSTPASWASRFFGATDSLKQYYNEVSYGQLSLAPASEFYGQVNDGVIGWITLNQNHPDTRGNTGDINRQLARDVMTAANPYVNYNYFDNDGNGVITTSELHVVTIIAGYETSYGGDSACTPSVWAHRWVLGGAVPAPTLDGVLLGDFSSGGGYTQFGEWHCMAGDNPGHVGTIGQMAHELGHDLGWPDLYDSDNSSEGLGFWSVMATGAWLRTFGFEGSLPSHPDPFSKWYQGWLTPQQILGNQNGVQLQTSATSARVVQVLDNPAGVDWAYNAHSGAGEYFLLENRQRVGYDGGIPGCGILLWHIDETRSFGSGANATDSRRLVDLEEADGLNHLDTRANRGDSGDPYPGSSANMGFHDTSNPSSGLYSGANSGVSVSIVSNACAGTMTVNINAPGGGATATATPTRTPTATGATATPTATPVGGAWTTILQDNFEGAWPGPWQLYSPPAADGYAWAKSTCRAPDSNNSAWAVGGGTVGGTLTCGDNYPDDGETWMYYGPFSLAGATAAELSFRLWYNTEDGFDEVCYLAATGDLYYGHCESGNSGGWLNRSLDLSDIPVLGNLLGQPSVSVGFLFRSDSNLNVEEGAYVDDVVLRKQAPAQVTATPTRTATRTATASPQPGLSPTTTATPSPSRTPGDRRLYLPVILSGRQQ